MTITVAKVVTKALVLFVTKVNSFNSLPCLGIENHIMEKDKSNVVFAQTQFKILSLDITSVKTQKLIAILLVVRIALKVKDQTSSQV